eukprot:TRINITY_DN1823_c0_g1_i4.p4 TRINITY_DN1823_c0_g1~~TRINITY_DN1823_c0_g1_i4.p4  ORF type:complete len:155 (+),score=22.56 TRINITY_DN1823_c0_g1_i4:246-710(+)
MDSFGLTKNGYVSLAMAQKAKMAILQNKKIGIFQALISKRVQKFDSIIFDFVVRDAEHQERTIVQDEPMIPFNRGDLIDFASEMQPTQPNFQLSLVEGRSNAEQAGQDTQQTGGNLVHRYNGVQQNDQQDIEQDQSNLGENSTSSGGISIRPVV